MPEHDTKNILIKSPETVQKLVYCPVVFVPAGKTAILATPPIPFEYWVLLVTPSQTAKPLDPSIYLYKICTGAPIKESDFNSGEDLFKHSGPYRTALPYYYGPLNFFRRGPFPAGSSVAQLIPIQDRVFDTYLTCCVIIETTKLTI